MWPHDWEGIDTEKNVGDLLASRDMFGATAMLCDLEAGGRP